MEEEDRDDPQRRETLEMLGGELDRMNRFVNDMLLLAKAERPDFLQLETLDLGALCEERCRRRGRSAERDWRSPRAPSAPSSGTGTG